MKRFLIAIFSSVLLQTSLEAQQDSPLYLDSLQLQWVDAQYNAMTLDEKVGQLFMVSAYSNRDAAHESEIEKLITEEHIGGLIFMQDQAEHQLQLTNRFQKASKIPLLIGMDAEWGLAMRLKGVERFPWNMTLGALRDTQYIFQVGQSIAFQAHRMGVHFNFAPSVDVNVNPNNPIIGNRSFGSDPLRVALNGVAYMKGLQTQRVISSAKHFPGHGDTDQDSHKTLPTISANLQDLEKYHIAPFKKLIDEGVYSVMVAHLNVPALDNSGVPSTLSSKIVTDYLKGKLGFKGIVITDALNMDGVAKGREAGEIDYLAFKAGNDILLFSQQVKSGKAKIIKAIESGDIPEARLEESVKKILMAKYLVGLHEPKTLSAEQVLQDLNSNMYKALSNKIYEKATTLVKNKQNIVPIKTLEQQKIAFVPLEEDNYQTFHDALNRYTKVDLIKISNASQLNRLNNYDYVIVGAFLSNETVYKSYKLSNQSKMILENMPANSKVIFSLFTSPYGLKDLNLKNIDAVLVQYQNTNDAQSASAQAIFGAIDVDGILPVEVNQKWKAGQSITTQKINRLGEALPEVVGVNSTVLSKIDMIAEDAIAKGYTPGMQILVAKDNKIIYDKAFGNHTKSEKKK
ncbi:glycoside hydrolase family 3 N-terminal domain-containing protein [Vaginella massiliensis]|uniref:glycoside hydrolase family 3 protein n=1 Tax=Vaginella massiliensis TaxID=1816680 RepID=UPI00374FFD27